MRIYGIGDNDFVTEYGEQAFEGEHRERTPQSWVRHNPDAIFEDRFHAGPDLQWIHAPSSQKANVVYTDFYSLREGVVGGQALEEQLRQDLMSDGA